MSGRQTILRPCSVFRFGILLCEPGVERFGVVLLQSFDAGFDKRCVNRIRNPFDFFVGSDGFVHVSIRRGFEQSGLAKESSFPGCRRQICDGEDRLQRFTRALEFSASGSSIAELKLDGFAKLHFAFGQTSPHRNVGSGEVRSDVCIVGCRLSSGELRPAFFSFGFAGVRDERCRSEQNHKSDDTEGNLLAVSFDEIRAEIDFFGSRKLLRFTCAHRACLALQKIIRKSAAS